MENYGKILEKLGQIDASVKSAHKRIDETRALTESVYKLATSIEAMQHDIKDTKARVEKIEEKPDRPPCILEETVAKLEEKVEALEAAPAKKWNLVITTVITSITSGVVGFLIAAVLQVVSK